MLNLLKRKTKIAPNEEELLQRAQNIAYTVRNRMLDKGHVSHNIMRENLPPIESCKVHKSGPYTVVILNDNFVGVSKRNPNDYINNNDTGLGYALSRACKKFVARHK